ncbi:MAG TPA: hemerythrin domain-containing protein [Acidimicrobiales bacterium]|nr:hemerythrin domain-containing protein [Acidimicrobiales bacterium]
MASTDAITMLKDDHQAVEQLFKRFEKAGDRAHVEKRNLVDRMIEALAVHAAIEEQVFYPAVRATVEGTEDQTLESLEEHHIVKWVLSELDSMSPEEERFDAKVTVLMENVRHHVEEEEKDLFPMVRKQLGRDSLGDLGKVMAEARKAAPTHPHPRSPDTPPQNLVVGAAAGVVDRIGDTVNGLAQGYVTSVGDFIATVLGRKKPRVSPTGSKVARDTAKRVRSGAADATDSVIDAILTARDTGERTVHRAQDTGSSAAGGAKRTARSARRGATRTAAAAKSGAKGTATSARRSSGRTATTAKRAATTTARQGRAAAKSTTSTAKRSVGQTRATASR